MIRPKALQGYKRPPSFSSIELSTCTNQTFFVAIFLSLIGTALSQVTMVRTPTMILDAVNEFVADRSPVVATAAVGMLIPLAFLTFKLVWSDNILPGSLNSKAFPFWGFCLYTSNMECLSFPANSLPLATMASHTPTSSIMSWFRFTIPPWFEKSWHTPKKSHPGKIFLLLLHVLR